jgi:hypothetical protein
MPEDPKERPECYGNLETVFPMADDGLRCTPDACMACGHKTECLQAAMGRPAGIEVREEMVDRAYASGQLTFLQRWSRRKSFSRRKDQLRKEEVQKT